MPATVPLLPPELELRIIDFVARIDDEDATLRACAMVSRRWNDLARPSMYRRVLVKSHIDSEAFLDLIKNNPSITELVLHLAVCDPEPNVEIPIKSPWALSFLNSLAGKLPRLDVLVLIGLHETGDTYTPNIFQNLSKFATIKRLEVLGCIFPMSLLFAYITSFPSIQQLAINWLVVTDKDHYAHPTPPPPLLTHIRLRAMEQPREFLSWIAASSTRCALRSLNVGIFDWPPGVLDEFLDSVGPSLKELDVKIVDSGDYSLEGYTVDVDLSKCTALETLTLRPGIHWKIPSILSHMSFPRLRTLRFSIPELKRHHILAYEVLAKQLQRMVLPPCFTEIRFIYKGDRDHLEQESPKIRDIFKRDKTRFPVNFMLSSDVERFWLTPHDY